MTVVQVAEVEAAAGHPLRALLAVRQDPAVGLVLDGKSWLTRMIADDPAHLQCTRHNV
jgi:hypothetical protein